MKKIILISSISIVLVCFISFLILSTHGVNAAGGEDKYVAAKSGINFRSGPDKSSKVITTILFGSKVTIEKSEGNEIFLDGAYGKWVNVKFGNKTGWVFSGFLCDFKPDTIIKPAADFYRNELSIYSKGDWPSHYKEFSHFKDSKVSIEYIIDNYIVLQVPFFITDGELWESYVVWKYDAKQKNFFEVYSKGGFNTTHLLYLDNDKYLDLVVEYECCSIISLEIFLGSENGFIKVYDLPDELMGGVFFYLMVGHCGDTEFASSNIDGPEETGNEAMYHFRFNCDKSKVEKYAESKIIKSSGIITSIDWENMSIAIKDNIDLKGEAYKFSDMYKYYDKNSVFGKHIESLKKDLQKGKDVSFSYETIDGKKIILDIRIK